MKSNLWITIAILAILSMACSVSVPVQRIQPGDLQTYRFAETKLEGNESAEIKVVMGAGELEITGGGDGLAQGEISTNVAEWKPTITRQGSQLSIEQDTKSVRGIPNDTLVNKWMIKLGKTPMKLVVNAGAYTGSMDFSGVPLTELSITDGASKGKVTFKEVNPVQMDQFTYLTGASTVELTGLANANFDDMRFEGGAGDYKLQFDGVLQREANVVITTGVSNLRIIIPKTLAVKITIGGGLSNVNPSGTWTIDGDVYSNPNGMGPLLSIHVDMGVGNLELVQE
jgi:hypothetical protein